MRIPFEQLSQTLSAILLKIGFSAERANECARLFAETTLDGVYSHGLNRFPVFIDYIEKGYVQIQATPEKKNAFGSWEQWEGNLGPGNLNAYKCMIRAIELSKSAGMSCVALRNTNHWMRAGTYGWQAAEKNCIAICFTNTIPNMPPWGGKDSRIGNNPLVIAIPGQDGKHIVLDTAMSMYSYGKMEVYKRQNRILPFEGGFSQSGELTKDPTEILASRRPLPIGYWKGSGLSILLDMLAALLSQGNAVADIGKKEAEYALSQVFICFDANRIEIPFIQQVTGELTEYLKSSAVLDGSGGIYYPGERTLLTRKENLEKGIPVDELIWEQVQAMLK
jgi:3-dehydro-L-gulonate 2-dehydrogenase